MPLTILVVDDDPGTRLAISDYLEMAGYSVITAADGQQGLDMVETYRPHLMVTDIVMPRMNGYQLVRSVRQHPSFRLLPVIFLTERNKTEERIQGYQSGADLYLPKPFELQELGAAIRNLLERSQMIQSEYRLSQEEGLRPQTTATAIVEKLDFPFHLTQREQEVLVMLTHGLSNAQIGSQLHLSPRTVEKYVSNLLRKTETNNRAELVGYAMKHRLVE
ncbi:MAG: Response regulator MprA [Chroococcidiopsis cubana SAG 39.79]|jgi:DNA-binding NarL/FixJ family response regulator|uniref:Two component transcriptional regulator, LuxR family n=3 Tax=Cyanophyceae TaxID=3028117 RepID=K9TXE6_CHRTP|nr:MULTISPECIES: response regulator transcription factor [Cyanophyceae]MBE9014624.1 response regulator transcription factor [Chroococcidiopsidales cyanobacterium LEGE 13417]PSB43360.1 DNA-binding response regulator [Cyanosarcina cf. burmensis CCALA 770]AFY87068.1 two component transcriptional regulator, LuxR family [Chroococcidiopsis thermalis PCC 7203]MBD2306118.1 response regulator transcription factor [Chroococcidiopsis sp. [FACHB-1243]]MDV2990962.1 Response regulator MprA [Chroococcidiopsi